MICKRIGLTTQLMLSLLHRKCQFMNESCNLRDGKAQKPIVTDKIHRRQNGDNRQASDRLDTEKMRAEAT